MPRLSYKNLPAQKLLSINRKTVSKERETTLDVLLQFAEIDRKEHYLLLGCRSMFEYCTRELRYSASAAARRLRSARLIARYPEVERMLGRGEANLTTLSMIAKVINDSNKTEILAGICNRTQREVEMLVSRYRPIIAEPDRVKPVSVLVPVAEPTENQRVAKDNHCRSGSESLAAGSAGGGSLSASQSEDVPHAQGDSPVPIIPPTRLEQKFRIQFLASEAFIKKCQLVKELLSNKDASSFEEVFEAMMDDYIDRHSPESRESRRRQRRDKADGNVPKTKRPRKSLDNEPSRHIPAAIRDRVFTRDGGQCAYEGANGRRCSATRRLQIDHVVPFARGGTSEASNLRLLCLKHNRLAAEQVYGTDMMKQFRRRE